MSLRLSLLEKRRERENPRIRVLSPSWLRERIMDVCSDNVESSFFNSVLSSLWISVHDGRRRQRISSFLHLSSSLSLSISSSFWYSLFRSPCLQSSSKPLRHTQPRCFSQARPLSPSKNDLTLFSLSRALYGSGPCVGKRQTSILSSHEILLTWRQTDEQVGLCPTSDPGYFLHVRERRTLFFFASRHL